MGDVVDVVTKDGFTGVELTFALIGAASIVRMGIVVGKVVFAAAKIVELSEGGKKV